VTLCRCLQSTCLPYAGLAATDYLTIQGAVGVGYGQSEKFPVNLTAEMVEMIQEWAATTHYVREVRLFGSRAKGGTAPDSDIDLAITVAGNDPAPSSGTGTSKASGGSRNSGQRSALKRTWISTTIPTPIRCAAIATNAACCCFP
jgi:Nucleotidyltransferase domain